MVDCRRRRQGWCPKSSHSKIFNFDMQKAIALFDCKADAPDDLSFNKDDELVDGMIDLTWWQIYHSSISGAV